MSCERGSRMVAVTARKQWQPAIKLCVRKVRPTIFRSMSYSVDVSELELGVFMFVLSSRPSHCSWPVRLSLNRIGFCRCCRASLCKSTPADDKRPPRTGQTQDGRVGGPFACVHNYVCILAILRRPVIDDEVRRRGRAGCLRALKCLTGLRRRRSPICGLNVSAAVWCQRRRLRQTISARWCEPATQKHLQHDVKWYRGVFMGSCRPGLLWETPC